MRFYNRETEIKNLKIILSDEPNLIYFVYGPINSGKTTLLMKVFEELPENYQVFYINFRGRYVQNIEDLIKVLFRVKEKREKLKKFLKETIKDVAKEGIRFAREMSGISISESLFDMLFKETRNVEDIFAFLEDYFQALSEKKKLIFVLDEIQTIKRLINAAGRPVIYELFNFMVRLTKETHLCHCLCATSDCLFIEEIYSNARLEGRAEYILVDDLDKEQAFKVYDAFGFEEKELIWDYIGGKFGDMIRFYEKKKRGLSEKEALKEILLDTKGKLKWFFRLIREGEKGSVNFEEVRTTLRLFKEREFVDEEEIKGKVLKFLIEENILFYNPVKGTVRPQSRLIMRAIKEIV